VAHEFLASLTATEDALLELVLPETATGLTAGTLDAVLVINDGVFVADPVTDLGMALVEVDSINAPGIYQLQVTPDRPGILYIRVTEAAVEYEYTIQVSAAELVSDPSLEGEFTITINDGTNPVVGAVVRVFDVGGSLLVTRGTTDALGQVVVSLPVGTYQYRVVKEGFDATAINPTTFIVQANDDVSPVLDEVVPGTASIGDTILLLGNFFADVVDAEVEFGTEATVAAAFVSAERKALLVVVPTLTGTVIPLRVVKPDPANPPLGKLFSNTLTMIRT
jgi:hypothetical protein